MSMYRDLILELCQGRFAKLAKYFEPLDDYDFKIIELEDIIISTEPCDRLLMKVFINKIENSIYSDLNKHNRYIEALIKPCMTIIKEFNLVYWNIRNKLLFSLFQSYGIYSKYKFTIEDGSEFIINSMKGIELSMDMIILLDFSENGFLDLDTKKLKPLIDRFAKLYPNNEIIIKLRYNHLHYCDEFIKELLTINKIKYIDLCDNSFVSLDRCDFFNTENEQLFNLIIDKIICTSKLYLLSDPWSKLFKKLEKIPNIEKRIQATHNSYYSITAQMALDDY